MKTVPVGDFATQVDYGVTASASKDPIGPKMLRITDIQNGSISWSTVPHCATTTKGVETRQLAVGDIVFARTGSAGKSLLIRDCPDGAVFASYLIRLRVDPETADPSYVGHFFQSPGYWLQIASASDGGVQKGVNSTKLKKLLVPLPPIQEQRRIVAVLDAADALRVKRRQVLAKLDGLTQSVFVDIFGDGSEWPMGRLGDHVPTTSGGTPSRSRPDYFGGHIPWVKSGELGVELVTATEEAITDEALANSSAKLMPVGTVLLAMYGATVGEASVLGVEAATNQAVCCLSPTESMSGAYLLGLLRSRKNDLIRRAAGGAQPNISQTIIRGLEVLLASIEAQAKYAERIAAIDKLRGVTRSSAAELDTLFASLQQRAFRGEL